MPFKLKLDEETAKQIRTELFRPLVLSIIIGLIVGLIMAIVASLVLGLTIENKSVSFKLTQPESWIIFSIFVAASLVTSVVSYYRLKEEHQKLTDDVLTPFRKELAGEWRVYWSDVAYSNEGGNIKLVNYKENDACTMGIDNAGKLYIDSELNNHPILEDWRKRIEDISINLSKNRLTFYDEARFTIRREKMKSENDQRGFEARFFVFLEAKGVDDKQKVTKYEGRWYDLDGIFAQFKETLARQVHPDLPAELHFPRSGAIEYVKSPRA
jgi:hypothetical protein